MYSQHNLDSIPSEFRFAAYDLQAKGRKLNVSRNAVLWTVQGLLALIFLFAGSMKLVLPVEELTKDISLPGLFLRFIGVVEVLGAVGLILPRLLKIRPGLTALAACGLVSVMIGATVLTVANNGVGPAVLPFVVGLLSAFVADGRSRRAPHRRSSHSVALAQSSEAGWLAASRAVFGASVSQ